MEEKKDKSDDPVVDLFPDDDADDRAGKTSSPHTLAAPMQPIHLMLTHIKS